MSTREAAAVVFGSGVPLTMVGLDVTHQVLVTPERLERFKALGGPLGEAGPWHAGLLQPLRQRALPGGRRAFARPVRDRLSPPPRPVPGPGLQGGDRDRGPQRRRTNVHWWPRGPQEPNANVIGEVDAAGLFELLFERLARLPTAQAQ